MSGHFIKIVVGVKLSLLIEEVPGFKTRYDSETGESYQTQVFKSKFFGELFEDIRDSKVLEHKELGLISLIDSEDITTDSDWQDKTILGIELQTINTSNGFQEVNLNKIQTKLADIRQILVIDYPEIKPSF
jgi:hypothetical protein